MKFRMGYMEIVALWRKGVKKDIRFPLWLIMRLCYPCAMGKGRLEAFSDGVIAIIITIMVLELKVSAWRRFCLPAGTGAGVL